MVKQFYLTHRKDYQVLPLQVRVDMGAMAMKVLSQPPTRQDLIQGQWPKGQLKVRIRGGKSQARASRGSNPAGLYCSLANFVQCEPE